jgi:hypothetical protein
MTDANPTPTTTPTVLKSDTPLAAPKEFALLGNATFTIMNVETGNRFTFKLTRSKPNGDPTKPPVTFVKVLTGADNESDYEFIGTVFSDGSFRRSAKSRISEKAPSVIAFSWYWRHLMEGTLPPNVHTYHEGRCGRCGRLLTVPESVERGIGPECWSKMTAVNPTLPLA